jgi:hypothetical protein
MQRVGIQLISFRNRPAPGDLSKNIGDRYIPFRFQSALQAGIRAVQVDS